MLKSKIEKISKYLDDETLSALSNLDKSLQEDIREIRFRKNAPISISISENNYFIDSKGNLSIKKSSKSLRIDDEKFNDILTKITDYSYHAKEQELIKGFISLDDGCRASICGKAILDDEKICGLRDISSIVIRISGNHKDAGKEILDNLFKNKLSGLVIAGEPGSGKTTILRDVALKLSDGYLGKSYRVAVIDERNEIAIADDDLTFDCLSGYPKDIGIITALRGLSPDIIICDELSTIDESKAIIAGLNGGVPIITTIHAKSLKECINKPQLKPLIYHNAFENLVILRGKENPSKIEKIYKREDLINEMDRNSNSHNIGNMVWEYEIIGTEKIRR
jgi:stage III sporulation protein AA